MDLKIKHFVLFITISVVVSCKKQNTNLTKIEGKEILIDSAIAISSDINDYVAPYRNRVNEILDSTLAYAPRKITKEEGTYNTPAGNLLADIVFEEAAPIFNARTGHALDFVLVNHGGIRSIISEGNVSARTAFEVMPFENSVVVAELSGKTVRKLISYLLEDKRPHPISGLQIILNPDHTLFSVKIQGKPLDDTRSYFVATSDYLSYGGDNMFFFQEAINITKTDYLIRNVLIDYFKKSDTIVSTVDNRYYRLKQ